MAYTLEALLIMAVFSFCSGSLLLVNKLIMHVLPLPSLVSSMQLLVTAIFCGLLKASGFAQVDSFEWIKVKPYLLYVIMFVTTLYCNMKALQFSNVETIIVFRACCPIVVSVLDWLFLGRHLPSPRSSLALLTLFSGAAAYVATDKEFKMAGLSAYSWAIAYFLVISVEMTYGKYIVGPQLGFASMWGPTLYTNTLSFVPMTAIGLATHELDELQHTDWTANTIVLLASSCVIGVAISYFGFRARQLVSATCFTVLGVANKMATVTVNALIWDQHASELGIASLFVCLLGAAMFQQPPLRDKAAAAAETARQEGTCCTSIKLLWFRRVLRGKPAALQYRQAANGIGDEEYIVKVAAS